MSEENNVVHKKDFNDFLTDVEWFVVTATEQGIRAILKLCLRTIRVLIAGKKTTLAPPTQSVWVCPHKVRL